ncbi:MAG: Gfo/Idh/MocA family oxidoreductase [Thermoguttaceae bacterium]
MSKQENSPSSRGPSRRDFLKTSAMAAGAVTAGLSIGRSAHAAGDDTLKVGLIGCGSRGTGAAGNALNADPNVNVTAMADVFEDRLQNSRKGLQTRYADRIAVDDDHCFVGFDAYQKVIDSGVDVVILTSSPHFRPRHLKAAVEAGKHVFCEKPVAVDATGIRSVLESAEKAKQKNLNLVSGLCWRYHDQTKDIMDRIVDGAIGDIQTIQSTYNTGTLWHRGRKDDDTEMKYQLRNWYYFTWLSGDHNCEQHVHSLDKASWAMGDQPPVRAWGLGGRQVRTEQPKWGNIYDHHAVVYEYANGSHVHSYCRQQGGCANGTTDTFWGTKGVAKVLGGNSISGENEYRSRVKSPSMYDSEHVALFNAIRAGETINNGQYMATSTMLAVLGRMVTYTGQAITWEDAINCKEDLSPSDYTWDADPPILPDENGHYPIAIPGVTKIL